MLYLTHFYKTGEKLRIINEDTLKNAYKKPLVIKNWLNFTPKPQVNKRNGIVIDFSK